MLLDTNVPAFSFIYGIPPKEILDEARKKGIVTLGTDLIESPQCVRFYSQHEGMEQKNES